MRRRVANLARRGKNGPDGADGAVRERADETEYRFFEPALQHSNTPTLQHSKLPNPPDSRITSGFANPGHGIDSAHAQDPFDHHRPRPGDRDWSGAVRRPAAGSPRGRRGAAEDPKHGHDYSTGADALGTGHGQVRAGKGGDPGRHQMVWGK